MNYDNLIDEISLYLDRFKKKRNGLFEFRCPICGDSKKSKYKTRGNIYLFQGTYLYKCHNCSYSSSLKSFVKDYFPHIYSRHCFSSFQKGNVNNQKEEEKRKEESIFLSSFDCLIPYQESEEARTFIKKRKLPKNKCSEIFYIEDVNNLIEYIPNKGYEKLSYRSQRIVFPVRLLDSSLSGFVTRAINDKDPIRYFNMKISSENSLLFGQGSLNFKKRVFIVEGIIDSLFLDNSLAACSSSFDSAISFCKEHSLEYVLLFDNEPRNTQIKKQMMKYINEGEFIVIFSSFPLKGKDINNMILQNQYLNIQDEIEKKVFKGLKAQLEFKRWERE